MSTPPRRPAHRTAGRDTPPRPVSARVRRRRTLAAALVVAAVGWGTHRLVDGPDAAPVSGTGTTQTTAAAGGAASSAPSAAGATPRDEAAAAGTAADQTAGTTSGTSLAAVAGLGPATAASVPAASTQVVLVRGDGPRSATTTIELLERKGATWRLTASWRGHVGARGWTTRHREGDLRTPAGTFSLTDAGGRRPDPGTRLPYDHSAAFVPSGDSVFGDSLAGKLDYVVAVNFNRVPGRSPRDGTRPQGVAAGGGIWLHVDHDGPTHGCVSVPLAGMRTLLRALDPRTKPVVVMGEGTRLAT